MITILLVLVLLVLLYWGLSEIPIWHGRVPQGLRFDQECLENRMVPAQLAWAVPLEYVQREGYSVASRVKRTFVHETKKPKWLLEITMSNPKQTSIVNVVYNLDGSIYEY